MNLLSLIVSWWNIKRCLPLRRNSNLQLSLLLFFTFRWWYTLANSSQACRKYPARQRFLALSSRWETRGTSARNRTILWSRRRPRPGTNKLKITAFDKVKTSFEFAHGRRESNRWLKTLTRIWKCTRCIMQISYLYASDFPVKNSCKLSQHATLHKWCGRNCCLPLNLRCKSNSIGNFQSIGFCWSFRRHIRRRNRSCRHTDVFLLRCCRKLFPRNKRKGRLVSRTGSGVSRDRCWRSSRMHHRKSCGCEQRFLSSLTEKKEQGTSVSQGSRKRRETLKS